MHRVFLMCVTLNLLTQNLFRQNLFPTLWFLSVSQLLIQDLLFYSVLPLFLSEPLTRDLIKSFLKFQVLYSACIIHMITCFNKEV